MTRWEHKVAVVRALNRTVSEDQTEDTAASETLNEYGRQGWELVAVTSRSSSRENDPATMYGYVVSRYYFKRPAAEE